MTAKGGKHRIILFNFTRKQADEIAKAGYNVEPGYLGRGDEGIGYLPYSTPHPIYEYDILIYNSHVPAEVQKEFSADERNALAERSFQETVASLRIPPRVRVSFIGETATEVLMQGGVPFLKLVDADANVSVSSLREMDGRPFQIPELHNTLTALRPEISAVGQFVRAKESESSLWRVVVLATRNGEVVMCYGRMYDDDCPHYIVLPQMKMPAKAAVKILRCLEDLAPSLFPDKVRMNWLESAEFSLPEELALDKEIEGKIAETKSFIEAKRQERRALAETNAFIRALLVAKEDPSVPIAQRLSSVVRASLEFLGFEVEDIDQKIKTAIKKEDFWVRDGDFLAITEVTGTESKNPKIKEFHDILGRMATLYKRQTDLVLPSGANIFGLLILNYDIATHPSKRPRPYTGQDAHIVETAAEQGIGILSTVDLHNVVMAVKNGLITRDVARKLIKKTGRIEYSIKNSELGNN